MLLLTLLVESLAHLRWLVARANTSLASDDGSLDKPHAITDAKRRAKVAAQQRMVDFSLQDLVAVLGVALLCLHLQGRAGPADEMADEGVQAGPAAEAPVRTQFEAEVVIADLATCARMQADNEFNVCMTLGE